MVIFRILGIWFVLLALVALTVDATKSLAASSLTWTSFASQWLALHATSFDAAHNLIVTKLFPWLWDPVLLAVLALPAWLVLIGLGILIYWIGRKRPPSRVYIN